MFQPTPGSELSVAPPADGVFDAVVIGAGSAGVGAACALRAAGLAIRVLEARDRAGGRARTLVGRSGTGIDLGCGWLHSAEVNPWAAYAQAQGFDVDRSRPAWERRLTGLNITAREAEAFHRAFESFEAKLAAAAAEPDRPAAELFDAATEPFRPMLDAFSGAYNGAPFRDISVHDYDAYRPTEENWRVVAGYGRLIAHAAAELPIALETPVGRIDRTGPVLSLSTPDGGVQAHTVVVAVPTHVLAEERLRFDPPLPEVVEAAAALPLGNVEKCFLALAEPDALPVEQMVMGRTDTAETGSYTLRPFGRPMVEGFFGGDAAKALEAEGEGAFLAFAREELAALFGSDLGRTLRPLAQSAWTRDPWIGGAYSHARPGHAGARAMLARPVEGRIFFAGEACSPHAFSTAHGAYETGVAAAQAVIAALRR